MHLTKYLSLLCISVLINITFSQTRVDAILLRIQDSAGKNDTLYCGFSRSSSLSYCIDNDTVDIPQYGLRVWEYELPPLPPADIFDARFIDSRTSSGTCLGMGTKYNFHDLHTGDWYKDTFKIRFQGSVPGIEAYPFTISWNIPTPFWCLGDLMMKYEGENGTVNIDMTDSTSTVISNFDASILSIIAYFYCDTLSIREDKYPTTYELSQNYPNPFNPTTTIRYSMPKRGYVTLSVYNILGEEVAKLINGVQDAGYQSIEFNSKNLPSGVYVYRLLTDQFRDMKRCIVVK